MKKLIFSFASLLAIALVAFFVPEHSALIPGGLALAITGLVPFADKENLERLTINSFSNFDDDDFEDFMPSNEQGIFTVTIVNSEAAARSFYLFNGELLTGANYGLQIIPALTVSGGATVAQLIVNSPIGQIVEGSTRYIGASVGTTATIAAQGSPFELTRFLAHCVNTKNQVISGIRIDSATAAQHTGNITVGKTSPYGDRGSKTINLVAFRRPGDFQTTVTMVPANIALKPDTYVKFDLAASATLTITLFMNGHKG